MLKFRREIEHLFRIHQRSMSVRKSQIRTIAHAGPSQNRGLVFNIYTTSTRDMKRGDRVPRALQIVVQLNRL